MIIKSYVKKQKSKRNLFLRLYFFLTIIFFLVFITFFFNTGYWGQIKNPFLNRFYNSGVNNYLKIFEIKYSALLSNFYNFKKINLNLSFKNVLKLEKEREEVLSKDQIAGGASFIFKEVPVKINFQNDEVKADLRLKGDRNIHFDKDIHTSYKISVKGNETILGLRKFSLMKPRARNYIHEWIFHELLAEGGLIKLKYEFLELNLNGKDQGLYVLEEGFDKILLERNKKRNGPIFSLHEEFSTEISNAMFEVYNKNYWTSPENIELTRVASEKLKTFFNGKKNTRDVLDEEKWAWFFATTDINNYFHGLAPKSVKFYYNPISSKIEPIGFDGHRSMPNYNKKFYNWKNLLDRSGPNAFEIAKKCQKIVFDKKCSKFVERFFFDKNGDLNEKFYIKYREAVLKISSKEFLDDFFSRKKKVIRKINSKIYSDYYFVDHLFHYGPGLYYFDKNDFYNMSKILNEYFKNDEKKIFGLQDQNKLYVYNQSINNDFIIKSLSCNDSLKFNLNFQIKLNIEKPNVINLDDFKKDLICNGYSIQDNISKKTNYKKIDKINIINNYLVENDSKSFKKFFAIKNNKLFLKNNLTIIKEDIYIPEDYIVKIKPSQKIILTNNAFIYSKSPWEVKGIENKKIEIRGEKNNFGGGLFIDVSKKKSSFENVEFSYLTGIKKKFFDTEEKTFYSSYTSYHKGKKNNFKEKIVKLNNTKINEKNIMGSINFYNTEVFLKDIIFSKINSEDAINIMNSNFKIENLSFIENSSDAIDLDFSNGEIDNVNFIHIGNDAIDFSGSEVKLNNASFNDVKDKAISIGENSKIEINKIKAVKSYIGISAKDGSKVIAKNIIMDKVKIPFASYIKKEEYNEPILSLNNVDVNNFHIKWIKDKKSKITYDDLFVGKVIKKIIPVVYRRDISLIK
ncbi:hypothetical protein N9U95_06055 [Candidatus Pelagibacter sp.]|nr:hypothetical protein [Candidatus Pelagibacter sp.]